jgi:hypothetical protein
VRTVLAFQPEVSKWFGRVVGHGLGGACVGVRELEPASDGTISQKKLERRWAWASQLGFDLLSLTGNRLLKHEVGSRDQIYPGGLRVKCKVAVMLPKFGPGIENLAESRKD